MTCQGTKENLGAQISCWIWPSALRSSEVHSLGPSTFCWIRNHPCFCLQCRWKRRETEPSLSCPQECPERIPASPVPLVQLKWGHTHQTRGTPHILSCSSSSAVSWHFFCSQTLGLSRAPVLLLRVSDMRNVSSSASSAPSRELVWICDEKLMSGRELAGISWARIPNANPQEDACQPHPVHLICFLLSTSQTELTETKQVHGQFHVQFSWIFSNNLCRGAGTSRRQFLLYPARETDAEKGSPKPIFQVPVGGVKHNVMAGLRPSAPPAVNGSCCLTRNPELHQ